MEDVLLLNADYSPLRILKWQRAICLLLSDKVVRVVDYEGREIRSPSSAFAWPAVVNLKQYVKYRNKFPFNRNNVFVRDHYTCQYCGFLPVSGNNKPDRQLLTLDHVVPQSHATQYQVTLPWNNKRVPVTCWENVVTCCKGCNQKKADRTPSQAGMTLRKTPKRPTPWEGLNLLFTKVSVPNEWLDFIPSSR